MIVSIAQPAYIPWLGYFDRIYNSDYHIVLDDVQIERNTKTSFTNRNKIKTQSGPTWLTVPIKTRKDHSSIINQVLIDNRSNWKRKHFNSLKINYSKCSFFDENEPWLLKLYNREWDYLSKFIRYYNEYLIDYLSIKTKFYYSSEMNVKGLKSGYILNLCKELGATKYISGPFGKDYLNKKEFELNKIEISYHNYIHPTYDQYGDIFEPNLSILDLIFNHGRNSLNILKNEIIG